MDTIKVVCGIICDKNKVLICRRGLHKSQGGCWEFPGGKIEETESAENALHRELKEELGMTVIIEKYYDTVVHSYETFTIELIGYICKFKKATFNMTDHDSYQWVKICELCNWELAPADIPLAKQLIVNKLPTQ
ncbi:MAG: (deoxy)nucleoside triphosphate pyrophosphohydrolase [Tannerellaceae bacterium]|nr:(deoxy)nucleoside triphosphate pyrophosphohydrolase [Tannerellaceae bacterium]